VRQVRQPTNHLYTVNLVFLFGWVVVEKTDRLQFQLRIFLQFLDDQRPCIPSADDQDFTVFPGRARRGRFGQDAQGETRPSHQDQ